MSSCSALILASTVENHVGDIARTVPTRGLGLGVKVK
jgi:hypothetical protein